MGKNLTQQKRGRGSPTFRARSFRYMGEAKNRSLNEGRMPGKIIDIIHCPGHSSPLVKIKYDDGEDALMIAPEGIKVGDSVEYGANASQNNGNTLQLRNIPEGAAIYNIECNPGDGGKFVRSAGAFAKIVAKMDNKVTVKLPSSKQREFNPACRASMGIVAGSGKTQKPLLKAGVMFHKMKARNKYWPSVSGSSMNAVDHPFGGHSSCRHKCSSATSRHAPPGRKVGKIAPRRTGRKKR